MKMLNLASIIKPLVYFFRCPRSGYLNLELKANSVDEMYALNDLAKWSHKHLTA